MRLDLFSFVLGYILMSQGLLLRARQVFEQHMTCTFLRTLRKADWDFQQNNAFFGSASLTFIALLESSLMRLLYRWEWFRKSSRPRHCCDADNSVIAVLICRRYFSAPKIPKGGTFSFFSSLFLMCTRMASRFKLMSPFLFFFPWRFFLREFRVDGAQIKSKYVNYNSTSPTTNIV